MNKDEIRIYKGDFGFRVTGVLLNKGKVLLCTDDQVDFWVLPGGSVNLYESSEEAIIREFQEEIGAKIEVVRLLWVVENSFIFDNQKTHGVGLDFLVKLTEEHEMMTEQQFTGVEDYYHPPGTRYEDIESLTLIFRWFDIDELDSIMIKPSLYHQALKDIPDYPVLYRNLEIQD